MSQIYTTLPPFPSGEERAATKKVIMITVSLYGINSKCISCHSTFIFSIAFSRPNSLLAAPLISSNLTQQNKINLLKGGLWEPHQKIFGSRCHTDNWCSKKKKNQIFSNLFNFHPIIKLLKNIYLFKKMKKNPWDYQFDFLFVCVYAAEACRFLVHAVPSIRKTAHLLTVSIREPWEIEIYPEMYHLSNQTWYQLLAAGTHSSAVCDWSQIKRTIP